MFDFNAPLFKRRLFDGDDIGLFWFALGSPSLVEIAVANGGDAVVLDMQHGLFDRATLEAAVAAVPRSMSCLVRTEDDQAASLSRALDSGAEGVLVPMVDTAEQAARAAYLCRFPPVGGRSGGGVRPLSDFAGYRRAADAAIAVGVMIETAAGLANAAAIAAVPEVDFIFIGSGDLALSLGIGPNDGDRLDAAVNAIRDACGEASKPCGIFTSDAAQAMKRSREGFALTVVANDLSVVMTGFRSAFESYRSGT